MVHDPFSELNPKLSNVLKDYAGYHRTSGNQVLHQIAIPVIVVSLLGLLSALPNYASLTEPLLRMDVGLGLWIFATAFYLRLDWKHTLPFCLVTLAAYFLGRAIPLPALWMLFIGGWIAQYVGHYRYEKKSPAFYKNAEHLFVGPFWVYYKLVGPTSSRASS